MREFAAAISFFMHAGFFIFSFLFARALRLSCPACGRRIQRAPPRGESEGPASSRLACPYCGHAIEPRGKRGREKPR